MAEDTKQTQKTTQPQRVFEFVVEVGDEQNSNVMWPMNRAVLRGRWQRSNMVGEADERFAHMPDLPGLCIQFSSSRRYARIYDPLANPNNERILEKARRSHSAFFGAQVQPGPEPTREFPELSADDLKSWIYWTRRLLDSRQCRVVQGTVPTMDEIKALPGKLLLESYDTGANAVRYKDDNDNKYMPMEHQDEPEAQVVY